MSKIKSITSLGLLRPRSRWTDHDREVLRSSGGFLADGYLAKGGLL